MRPSHFIMEILTPEQMVLYRNGAYPYLRSECGIMMGCGPPAHPWEEYHLWTASNTSVWKIPSSESSSGKRADPRDLDVMSCWRLRLWASDSVVNLLRAPSRGVLGNVDSVGRSNNDVSVLDSLGILLGYKPQIQILYCIKNLQPRKVGLLRQRTLTEQLRENCKRKNDFLELNYSIWDIVVVNGKQRNLMLWYTVNPIKHALIFVVLCFMLVISSILVKFMRCIYPYHLGLLHWYQGKHGIAPLIVK